MNWPVRPPAAQAKPRLVPLAANSITVSIILGTTPPTPVASHTLTRPSGNQAATSTYTFGSGGTNGSLPVGYLTATATAYPNADGTGTAQATGTVSFSTAVGTNVPITINMGSTIDHLAVTPVNPTISAGATVALSATALDASGAMVLTAASKVQWASSASTIASVDPSSGVVTGVAAGSATITVTDSESGKSVTTNIIVTGGGTVAYTITDLGTLPGASTSYATGLNNAGQVIGYCGSGQSTLQAFLYTNGQMQGLGTLPGKTDSEASAINSAGQVVGRSDMQLSSPQAFLYSNGKMQDLGTLPGTYDSYATGINDAGQIIGSSGSRAFLYSNGKMQDLNTLLGSAGIGVRAINNSGQMAGGLTTGGIFHAFLYSNGQIQDLGTLPGGTSSGASGINNVGQVVGVSDIAGGANHVFLYSNGKMQDLGTLPGSTGIAANAINDAGQVVGDSSIADSNTSVFLYSNGRMQDLNTLIPTNSGWLLTSAGGINDNGQICGNGYINGKGHAFLLTPIAAAAHSRR